VLDLHPSELDETRTLKLRFLREMSIEISLFTYCVVGFRRAYDVGDPGVTV